jgi:FkbM family methyltransferase
MLRALTRHYPLYSGCGRIAALPLLARPLTGRGNQWVKLRDGPEILTPVDDWVGRALYYFGDLDRKLSWICRRLLREGDTMLDIGANIGVMSLVGRHYVGRTGAVHSFEPQPRLCRLLRESAMRNGFTNMTVHACALGEKDATLELRVPDSNLGAASLTRSLDDYVEVERVPVPVKQTSAYLHSLNLGPIRLIKMDVEGHEAQVLEGGLDYFGKNRPDAIIFELNDHRVRFDSQPVISFLSALGYEFLSIPRAIFRMRLRPVDSENYGHDILALASDRRDDLMTRLR